MEWIKIISVIGSLLGALFYIHQDTKRQVDKMDAEIREQAKRSDRLYEMFIELLKNKNTP